MNAPRKWKLGRGGFTLVELLVAITIVLIFGAMATETLKEGAAMWRTGYRRSYAYDTSTVIFQQLQDDMSAAASQFWGTEANAYDQNVKFWVDFDALKDSGGNTLAARQWMRFVRGIPDDDVNPLVRNAGSNPLATGWYNLENPNTPNPPPDLMPLGGKCEVAYMMGLGAADSTTLYRAVLAPIGCTVNPAPPHGALNVNDYGMTFFSADGTANDPLGTPALIGKKAQPLAQGVIHMEIRLWSQYTTTWEPSVVGYNASVEKMTPNPSGVPYWWANIYTPATAATAPPDGLGALYTWNSDRVNNAGPQQFPMNWGQAGFVPFNPNYATDPTIACDNVFPRAVMVVLAIEPPNELSVANPLRLAASITKTDTRLPIIGEAPPMNTEWPFVKIEDEWIRVNPAPVKTATGSSFIVVDATGTTESVAGRGVRGTAVNNHPTSAGAPLPRVLVGYTFMRVFNNPAAREYWGQ